MGPVGRTMTLFQRRRHTPKHAPFPSPLCRPFVAPKTSQKRPTFAPPLTPLRIAGNEHPAPFTGGFQTRCTIEQ